jgi:hypothetical protein
MTIQSASFRSNPGQGPVLVASLINTTLTTLGPISLIAASILGDQDAVSRQVYDVSLQYRPGGLASYQADAILPAAGVDLDTQVAAFFTAQADLLWPRFFFDLSSRTTQGQIQACIVISEVVTATGDGSYAFGDQEAFTTQVHIGEALGNIAVGATGSVRLYSPSGRYRDVAATNKGNATLPVGERTYILTDHISQEIWAFPTC